MWSGFDPQLLRELEQVRRMVSLRRQTPTREWPLIVDEANQELLVVREWPDGTVTSYLMSTRSTSA
jgi:hypothetical protein